jgi:hypothetical protein
MLAAAAAGGGNGVSSPCLVLSFGYVEAFGQLEERIYSTLYSYLPLQLHRHRIPVSNYKWNTIY